MPSILAALLEQAGHDSAPKNSTIGRIFLAEPVRDSFELQRIEALPRRRWQDTPPANYTGRFARNPSAKLLPLQEAALAELATCSTCNVVASLGAGKTLITALAPLVLGAQRPLFLNYARLLDKTAREFRALSADWYVCQGYTFLSVERLSLASYADYLERLRPDVIVIDEAHSLADPKGARFRRLRRYRQAHPEVPIVLLTATPGTDSIAQYSHLQDLLLGEGSPLPREWCVLQEWREALDTKVQGQRRPPGALTRFSEGIDTLDAVRTGVGTRVEQTRGNIYLRTAEAVDCSLYLGERRLELQPETQQLIASAWRDVELPDGRCFEELYSKPLILKQLGAGYAKVLDPIPPLAWREARSLWSAYVREIVSHESRYGLDTPGQVKAAVRSGQLDDGGLLDAWCQIERTFMPRAKTAWFDFTVVNWAAEWAAHAPGLIWVTQPTVGRKLAELTGLPFFHANGVDAHVGSIESYHRDTSAILAVRPNMLGRNLQRWHRNLYITPPSSATELDQSIGRTARRGQTAATVDVTFLFTVYENWASVTAAREAVRAERALGRNESSRLLVCDWCVSDASTVRSWKGPCWKR